MTGNWNVYCKHILSFFAFSLLVLGVMYRIVLLDSIPFSFYHDELDYITTGKSVAEVQTDISGKWNPLSLLPVTTVNVTAEITPLFHAVFYAVTGASILWGRVVAVFFSIATLAIVYLLFKMLTQSKQAGLWAAAFVAINPWHIYISRSGFEGPISLFFQIVFVYFVLRMVRYVSEIKLHWRVFLLYVIGLVGSFLLAFFTYHAAKFTALLIAVISIFVFTFSTYGRWKKGVVIAMLFISISGAVGWFIWQQAQGAYGSRQSELLISQTYIAEHAVDQVNTERRLSLVYQVPILGVSTHVLNQLVINKYTFTMQEIVKQYASVFDIYRLFVTGYEGGFQFSLIVHSYFMLSSLFFIPIGVFWFVKYTSGVGVLLFVFFIVSPIASAITISTQSIFRSALTYLILASISGIGAWYVINGLKKVFLATKKTVHRLMFLAILCLVASVLVFEAGRFGYSYFAQYSIRAIDNHDFKYRLLSEYLQRVSESPITVVVSQTPWAVGRAHVAYADLFSHLSAIDIESFSNPQISRTTVGEVVFDVQCPSFQDILSSKQRLVIEADKLQECGFYEYIATQSAQVSQPIQLPQLPDVITGKNDKEEVFALSALASPLDSRTYYWIFNDPLCDISLHQSFIHPGSFEKYRIHMLSDEMFCDSWFKVEYF